MIRGSLFAISGVVFSGGEPTMQKEPLRELARISKGMGLAVGVQTNGVFPATLEALIREGIVDRVALDIKARWARYNNLLKGNYVNDVQKSLAICREAHEKGRLPEFEVVITLFRGYDDEVPIIAREAGGQGLCVGVEFVGLEASEQGRQKLRRIIKTVNDYEKKNRRHGKKTAVTVGGAETEQADSST